MPPLSKHLWQEGAAIVALKLVQGGEFQEAAITEALMAPAALPGTRACTHVLRFHPTVLPHCWPGCSGCRNLSDSLSDLKAQVREGQGAGMQRARMTCWARRWQPTTRASCWCKS